MHVRTHVAGIGPVHLEVRVLDSEDGGELIERRLARAVAAPSLVWRDAGVTRDVHDVRARLELPAQLLQQRERGEHVREEHLDERLERIVEQRRLWGWAELAGVVHDGVEPGVSAREHGERVTMLRVDDVAGEWGNVRDGREL